MTPHTNRFVAGTELPESVVDVTTFLVVAGAIATRDFQAVHHNRDAALAAGTKDVFMNILTTNGLVCRYITEWAGPSAQLTKLNITLGATNYPGDRMTLRGAVDSVAEDGTTRVVVQGTNSLGTHVTGFADLRINEQGARSDA